MIDSKKMGRFIVEKRKALGLTQTQLSEKLNVSFQAISKWENGVTFPNIEILKELASV
ncbi:MAG: helix-turn-helix transcriptional regulator, partial [Clostridiales bacterium]|nr:helix-turn-helix transcriptional regulator [Clostridiales bacterium]